MSYSHLTMIERGQLEALTSLHWSIRRIAAFLGRHPSTISRERRRQASSDTYQAAQAQKAYHQRRKACGRKGKATPELLQAITHHLHATWSPEQIARYAPEVTVGCGTIYRWLYQGLLAKGDLRCLRQKGKRKKVRETRGRFTVGRRIEERPAAVETRQTFGHWEMDTIVSSRGKSKGCLVTLTERKSRYLLAVPMPDRRSGTVATAVETLMEQYPRGVFESITVDRGKEFACFPALEARGVPVYFADPYAAWQRGTNENANGLLREFFPKGMDLARLSQQEVDYVIGLIHRRPRNCLHGKTTENVFHEEVLRLN